MALFGIGSPESLFERGMTAMRSQDYQKALQLFLKAAEKGHARAACQAGRIYSRERCLPGGADHAEAFRWFLRGAELGDTDAMYRTALAYFRGKGTAKSCSKAQMYARRCIAESRDSSLDKDCRKLLDDCSREMAYEEGVSALKIGDLKTGVARLTKAADMDSLPAVKLLITVYTKLDPDGAEVLRWHRRAAELGRKQSRLFLARSLFEGKLTEKDSAGALEMARQLAEDCAGNDAETEAGARQLIREIETETTLANAAAAAEAEKAGDTEKAAELYQKAAEGGSVASARALALLYDRLKRYEDSFPWHLKAAQMGDADAMYDTADSLYYGDGTEADPEKALEWARKAAEAGNEKAGGLIDTITEGIRRENFEAGMKALREGKASEAAGLFRRSAEAGSPEAAWNLSVLYEEGRRGLAPDEKEALRWCLKAAELGSAKAMFKAAKSLFKGQNGAKEDLDQALVWARKARESGQDVSAAAADNLIREITMTASLRAGWKACREGDFTGAAERFETAARNESPRALEVLAFFREEGLGMEKDEKEAFRRYLEAARSGSRDAMRTVALRFAAGSLGAPLDPEQAEDWTRKVGGSEALADAYTAADPAVRAESDAAMRRGDMAESFGDAAGAVRAWQEAVEKGCVKAAETMANAYSFGHHFNIQKDEAEGFRWRLKAAEMGHPQSMVTVAYAYATGEPGAPKDREKALFWANKARDTGKLKGIDARAAETLLEKLHELRTDPFRQGVDAYDAGNREEAARQFETAARQGNGVAAYNLGLMYEKGDGVAKDSAQSLRWFHRSAELGEVQGMFTTAAKLCYGGYNSDFDEALRWAKKARDSGELKPDQKIDELIRQIEDKGIMQAAFRAGERGDSAEEIRQLKIAADRGVVVAAARLGTIYQKGEGIPADEKESFRWNLKAAEMGDPSCMSIVAAALYLGKGTAKDCRRAIYWARKAKDTGKLSADTVSRLNDVINLAGEEL